MASSYRFVNRPLESGLYEPEGIYLSAAYAGRATLLQRWGENRHFYRQFQYNGTALKGHPGVDFGLPVGTDLLAVDSGRVTEISMEPGGFDRYLKLEHRWGESFYAHIGAVIVEAGQMVGRGDLLALSQGEQVAGVTTTPHVHFAIRISPYNRFDGWGGFTDPLPFMDPSCMAPDNPDSEASPPFQPPPFVEEVHGMRRP